MTTLLNCQTNRGKCWMDDICWNYLNNSIRLARHALLASHWHGEEEVTSNLNNIYDVSAEGDSDLPAFPSPAGWIKGKWTETEYLYYGIGTTWLLSQNAGLPMTESVYSILRSNQHKLGRCLVLVYLQSQIQTRMAHFPDDNWFLATRRMPELRHGNCSFAGVNCWIILTPAPLITIIEL